MNRHPQTDRQAETLRQRAAIPTVAEAGGAVMTLRRVTGGVPTEMSKDDREQLLADALAGKLVSLDVEAVTFIQRDTPNRNLVRFKPGALQRLAPSFAGMPVLRDHEQGNALARGGTIIESKLEDRPGEDGAKQIRMTLRLTAPWAVEMALRGLMDRFSIGWDSSGETLCSVCGEPMTRFWLWTFGECEHELGAEYDGKICQLEYTDAEGVEVSAVSVPAVLGTGVEDVRAQLAAARLSASPAAKGQKKEPRMSTTFPLILAALGLAADAGEELAVAEIQKREALLKAERDRAAGLEAELAGLRADVLARRKTDLLERAKREGKVLPSSELEAQLSKLADTSMDIAEALVKDLPRLAPVGPLLVSAGGDPKPRAGEQPAAAGEQADQAAAAQLSPRQLKLAKQMGVTPAEYAEQLKKEQERAANGR